MADNFTHSNRVKSKDFLQNAGAMMDADFDWNRIVKWYSDIMHKLNSEGAKFADAYVKGSGKYVEGIANQATDEIANALKAGKVQTDKMWKELNWKDKRYVQIRLFRLLYTNYFEDKVMTYLGDGTLDSGLEQRLIARIVLFTQYFCTQDSGILNPETETNWIYPELTRLDPDVDIMLFINHLYDKYNHVENGESREATFSKWSKLARQMKSEALGSAKDKQATKTKVENAGISALAFLAIGALVKG